MRLSIEEVKSIIFMIERDIREYKYELEEYKAGRNEDFFDTESAIYYERERIPQLVCELEYYKNYFID